MNSQTNTSEKYEPTKYYIDIETTPCHLDSQGEHNINYTEEVVIGSEQGTTFTTRVGTTMFIKYCNALIDTVIATRCCMSEEYYKKITTIKIHLLQNVNVRSATGSNLAPIGLVNCTFMLGDTSFNFDFTVCKNLTRSLILGRDFLIQNHIAVRYSENGKCILDHQQQELVAAMDMEIRPHLSLANSISLPGRTLAVVQVNNTLTQEQSGHLYEIEPNYLLTNEYPNLYIVPTIHNVDLYKSENVPLVVINFWTDNIYLPKGEIMGFMQSQSLDISEIVTKTSTEPSSISLDEDNDTEESRVECKMEAPFESNEKKFITSPADIDIHRKVYLQDAEVTREHQEAFRELCNEYKDIFSTDSSDIGKTPLVEMEIDMGDSPPITQKPYTLPLKHAAWVQKELEILEKVGVIVRSVSPWASPIVVVPKRTAPGEPPKRRLCVDYRAVNGLLPPVKKGFFKCAKGILTLVPLPKIDEIYISAYFQT